MHKMIMGFAALVATTMASAVEGERTIFAHYMTCFYKDIPTYRKEMLIAQQYGVEGWALNCGNWQKKDAKTGEWVPNQSYMNGASNVFEAAKQLGTGFKVFFSPDGSKETVISGNHPDMGVRYHKHPNLFRYAGRPFISGWGGSTPKSNKYPLFRQILEERGVGDYMIVPAFDVNNNTMYETFDLIENDIYRDPNFNCDGVFFFGCDNSTGEFIDRLNAGRLAALKNNKVFMAGPCPAYNSSNLRDYHGVAGYAEMWKTIVDDQPELVEIVTWNDNAEDSGIFIDGWTARALPHELQSRIWACRDESFLDLTAYFAAAYKSKGRYPTITQDKIYAAYRPRSKNLTMLFRPEEDEVWKDERDTFLQVHDDVKDNVYMSAMLQAPAELEIRQRGLDGVEHIVTTNALAGFRSLAAPMVPGATPEFTIRRNGQVVVSTLGRRQIAAKATERNSLTWGYNGTQRMWTQCAVAGTPVVVWDATKGTEWTLPEGFKTGSYSFRVKYINDTDEEARYSFYVDLPWLGKDSREYVMPLYLPPTGGKEGEVAFLWSIPEGATAVRIVQERVTGKEKKWIRKDGKNIQVPLNYDWSDWGGATLKSVAVVRNEVTKWDGKVVPAVPEMVEIPGGIFTMSAKPVEVDEGKPHQVTVSPFAIGKYEVTNREFEEFAPKHRAMRSATSWRDNDPVIYVSWAEARAYCNWLSKKEGLTPAYDEAKGMARIADANGYRLPTEAEWEYVASGRGENRVYPWGNEPHTKSMTKSVAVRGADPTDVTRDGVYDMGGNVCEWCEDNYHYEMATADATDPCDTRAAKSGRMNFRSIRGGSFGYYGSPRVCDREYNSPRYRGYIYIGFRVCRPSAVNEATYKKAVDTAWSRLLTEFRSERTGLIYEHCADGDATRYLPRPDEIAKNEPVATGWSTGMEDGVLNGCPLLLAAIMRGDKASFDKLYPGIMRCSQISGKPGVLVRSISPEDNKSFYYNCSRDQYTLFVYTMWRVYQSDFATPAIKDEVRRALVDIAKYAETCITAENDYNLLRYDGKVGQVLKMWVANPDAPAGRDCWNIPSVDGVSPHESERLPMIYAAAYSVSGDKHWREMELRYADAAIRIANLRDLPSGMACFTLYQMQVSQRLLWECETDVAHKAKYLDLMQYTASVAANGFKRVEERMVELNGDLTSPASDWRLWPREDTCEGGVLNGLPYRRPIRPQAFLAAYDCVREAGEQIAVRVLCPGLELTASELAQFRTFVASSGFEKNNSSGIVYPLLADAMLQEVRFERGQE